MTVTELITQLSAILARHGDLPCGGESNIDHVELTVCDAEGHDAEAGYDYCGPAHGVFIQVS